ncbi:MAG: hypothetical protein IJ608_01100 [Lachnospiraceae bacterium]|nr:hypothetical protein [Lachnospiraceae bacterium]
MTGIVNFSNFLGRRSRGIISVLLAVVFLPFYFLGTTLVELVRYQSSANAMDQAISNSEYSTLAGYDEFLFDRFGFLTIDQNGNIVDLSSNVQLYLGRNLTVSVKGASVDSVTAMGLNPLSDKGIMKQQILTYSGTIVPYDLVMNGLEIDEFIKKFDEVLGEKGMNDVTEKLKKATETLKATREMMKEAEGLWDELKVVYTKGKEYNDKFTAWADAVKEVEDSYNSKPEKYLTEESTDEITGETSTEEVINPEYEEWESSHTELIEAAVEKGSEYVEVIVELTEALKTLKEKKESTQAALGRLKGDMDALNGEAGADEESASDMFDEAFERLSNVEELKEAIDGEGELVGNHNYGDTESAPEPAAEMVYHAKQKEVDGLNPDEVLGKLKEKAKDCVKSKLLDFIEQLQNLINSLSNPEILYDRDLQNDISGSSFSTLSKKLDDPPEVKSDFERAQAYNMAIGHGNLDAAKKGTALSAAEAALDNLSDAIDKLKERAKEWKEAKDEIAKGGLLKAIGDLINPFGDLYKLIDRTVKVVEALGEVLVCIGKFTMAVLGVMAELGTMLAQRIKMMYYLAYTLPNRTTYEDGSNLTGYEFSEIGLERGSNKAFAGAELEYLLSGKSSEKTNQLLAFWKLYGFRFLLDVVFVYQNTEVKALSDLIALIPFVGPALKYIYIGLTMLLEPFLDMMLLVNKGDVKLIKEKSDIMATPTGVFNFLMKWQGLIDKEIMSEEAAGKAKGKVQDEINSAAGIIWNMNAAYNSGVEEAENVGKNVESKVFTPPYSKDNIPSKDDEPGALKKKLEEINEIDYTQHWFILMCVLGSGDTYMSRLGDLVQMEKRQRGNDDFNIDQAYTGIRAEVTGSMIQVLPIPTMSARSALRYDRIVYRGY